MQSALVRGRATRSCGPSVDPARKLRGMTSPVTVHALLCSMRILAFSRLHVVFSLSCRLFHTTRFFHFQFSTLSTSLLLFRAKLFGTPSFVAKQTPISVFLARLRSPCWPWACLRTGSRPQIYRRSTCKRRATALSRAPSTPLGRGAASRSNLPHARGQRVSRLVTKRAATVYNTNAARFAAVAMGQELLQQLYKIHEQARVAQMLHEAAQVEARANHMLLTIEQKWLALRTHRARPCWRDHAITSPCSHQTTLLQRTLRCLSSVRKVGSECCSAAQRR